MGASAIVNLEDRRQPASVCHPCFSPVRIRWSSKVFLLRLLTSGPGTARPKGDVRVHGESWRVSRPTPMNGLIITQTFSQGSFGRHFLNIVTRTSLRSRLTNEPLNCCVVQFGSWRLQQRCSVTRR
jgi:hypothetical protein